MQCVATLTRASLKPSHYNNCLLRIIDCGCKFYIHYSIINCYNSI